MSDQPINRIETSEPGRGSKVVLSPGDFDFVGLLDAAAQLQERVPDMVMVGGSAAVIYARHRYSTDHDHVLADLSQRYDAVLDAVEASDGWATSIKGRPPMTILGMEAGFEAGIRQLRRTRPIETQLVVLPSGRRLTIPTQDEILRIKGYLVVNRNQMRDYLDVAALASEAGVERAAQVLSLIDEYYSEKTNNNEAVSTVLVERLASAEPRDTKAMRDLARYKGLDPRWADWSAVAQVCSQLAKEMIR